MILFDIFIEENLRINSFLLLIIVHTKKKKNEQIRYVQTTFPYANETN